MLAYLRSLCVDKYTYFFSVEPRTIKIHGHLNARIITLSSRKAVLFKGIKSVCHQKIQCHYNF